MAKKEEEDVDVNLISDHVIEVNGSFVKKIATSFLKIKSLLYGRRKANRRNKPQSSSGSPKPKSLPKPKNAPKPRLSSIRKTTVTSSVNPKRKPRAVPKK